MQLPNSPKGRAGPGLQQIVHQIECFYISFRTAVGYLVLYIFSLDQISIEDYHSFIQMILSIVWLLTLLGLVPFVAIQFLGALSLAFTFDYLDSN